MHAIDMHCDTLMLAYLKKKADIFEMDGMLDIKRMQQGGAMAQFFAAFMLPAGADKWFPGLVMPEDWAYLEACRKVLEDSVAAHSDILALAKTAEDIRQNMAAGKMSAVFTIEDGRAVDGKLANIDRLYEMGARAVSLTWNFENCFGAPNSKDPAIMEKGLTEFGKEAVVYMQEKGMLVDVSHLSDGGFYEVAALCKKPFVATHSNCRALCPHPRNMTDDMIKLLAEKGGVMGLNFGPEFLNEDITCENSTVERMVAMAQHEKQLGGVDVIAIGTDFDGIGGQLDISDCSKMDLLAQGLAKGGFTEDEIEKIFCKNVLRVMQDAL